MPEGIRTPDKRLRRPLLYPAELQAQACVVYGAGDGNRTHAASLEGWYSTIELHPHFNSLYIIYQRGKTVNDLKTTFCKFLQKTPPFLRQKAVACGGRLPCRFACKAQPTLRTTRDFRPAAAVERARQNLFILKTPPKGVYADCGTFVKTTASENTPDVS